MKKHDVCFRKILVAGVIAFPAVLMAESSIPEPYEPLHGHIPGVPIAASPDPLSGYTWENPQAGDALQIYELQPQAVTCDHPEKLTRTGDNAYTVTGPCNVRFDFGVVSPAWFELDSDSVLPGSVTCSISEHNEPSRMNGTSQSEYKTRTPVRYGNSYRLELNNALYEGVRYGWVHVPAEAGTVSFGNVHLVCQAKPVNYQGAFDCDNEMLNRIWYTAAYTVRTNLLADCFGAILMERGDRFSWTGDAYVSQAAALVAFGNYDFILKNIVNTSTQSNGILSYELYWVQSVIDYFNYTGDEAVLKRYATNINNKLVTAINRWGTNPHLNYYGWDERLGAGFENGDCAENQLAYKMLCLQTCRMAADAFHLIGEERKAATYEKFLERRLGQLAEDTSWQEQLALFSATDAVNAGAIAPEALPAVWDNVFADRLQRLSYSPFNQFFVLNALARMGRYGEAMHTIDDCWGGQIRYGGTTFFEVYRPSWNDNALAENDPVPNCQVGFTSLTHPWSAGVAKWLSEEVLGVKPTTPGFATFSVKPHLTCGLTRVSGKVPTPNGAIAFAVDTQAGTSSVTVPEGSTASVAIPCMGAVPGGLTVDGAAVEPAAHDADFVYLPELAAGDHDIRFSYTGEPVSYVPSETFAYPYPNPVIAEDTITKGNWRGVYGKDGYMLFSYDGDNNHRMNLPEGCEIGLRLGGNYRYPGTSLDPRAIQSPDENSQQRELGVFFTLDPRDCLETCTIDLDYNPGGSYDLTLYFVDWEGHGRRSAIEIFDMNTLEMVAPVCMVREYYAGRYITLRLDRPVRLRINNIRGDNAALAAMFFDNVPASGVQTTPEAEFDVAGGSGEITVTSGKEQPIILYTPAGEVAYSGIVPTGMSTLKPMAQGVYILNGKKVLVK